MIRPSRLIRFGFDPTLARAEFRNQHLLRGLYRLMRIFPTLLLILWTGVVIAPASEAILPAAAVPADFASLQASSPFSRTLSLSDSLILTGIATVDDEQVATLLNKETKESYVVSSRLNSQGWKMVELQADADLEKVAAKVAIAGGEVVTVRYAEWQLKPGESKPGAGAGAGEGGQVREGERRRFGDGGGGPPPEIRERMEKLTEEQRTKLFTKMAEIREKHPEMSRDEGREKFHEMLEKMAEKK